tara:strand:+ start:168 stop:353 length:186 start_codon:yes stop_codon:yes gene_type:complete
MANVNINGKEFDYDSLSDKAKANLVSLKFAQDELSRLQAQTAIYKTAEAAYSRVLNEEISE